MHDVPAAGHKNINHFVPLFARQQSSCAPVAPNDDSGVADSRNCTRSSTQLDDEHNEHVGPNVNDSIEQSRTGHYDEHTGDESMQKRHEENCGWRSQKRWRRLCDRRQQYSTDKSVDDAAAAKQNSPCCNEYFDIDDSCSTTATQSEDVDECSSKKVISTIFPLYFILLVV